jgi:hypothetical protein
MHSALPPKPRDDDPCDLIVISPDIVRVAPSDVVPSDEELSSLLHQAARHRSDSQPRPASDFSAGATAPPVDTTFRPSLVKEVVDSRDGWPMARRAVRAFVTLLLAACIGLTAVAWKSYGDVAKKKIAKLATQLALTTSLTPEKQALAEQPAPSTVQADTGNAASPQLAPHSPLASPPAPEVVAPAAAASADSAQLLRSMARDLASLGQEVEQLKAGMEQLKTSQQQTSHDTAEASRQNLRTRITAPSPRSAAARPRKPTHSVSPQTAAAPVPQTYYTPYYAPRQSQPQTMAEPPAGPELLSVPRPPMPVR